MQRASRRSSSARGSAAVNTAELESAMVGPLWRRNLVWHDDLEQIELTVLDLDQRHQLGRNALARRIGLFAPGPFPALGRRQRVPNCLVVDAASTLDGIGHEVHAIVA